MRNLLKAAIKGVQAELRHGESGWVAYAGDKPFHLAGRQSKSGQTVNSETALSLSAVWSCVQRTSALIGSLPVALYEKQDDGSRVRIDDDELSQILTVGPNSGQTSLEFWESAVAQVLLQGNAYAEKLYVGNRMVGLNPVFNVTPRKANGSWTYDVIENGRKREIPGRRMFHLRGFGGGDGLGLSAVRYGVQSFGSAISADEVAGNVFGQGMMPSGTLEVDQSLTSDQRSQLRKNLEAFEGSSRAGKTMVLESGMKFNRLSINPEDAQLLETRRFQVEDICRWFGVPPIVIGHAGDGQTMWGTGVEAIMLAWLTTGINPLLRRIEARIARDLIPDRHRGRWYVEWNREAMLQMDSGAKAEFLSRMVTSGIMTSDESREKLNLKRRGDAADVLRAQTALAPLEELLKGDR